LDKSISRAEELARIGRENDLAELEYEDSEVKIHLTFEAPQAPQPSINQALLATLSAGQTPSQAPAQTEQGTPSRESQKSQGETINSPLAGVFYRASRPDAEPFVKESDQVTEGQTLCIVEAMKLMNEIGAERACKISKILVENAEAVEEGQPLFLIG
jgi:acetyl-CoA carboxylase biotin carboxyl carrier protein